MSDVNLHPKRYNRFPFECWDINQYMPANLANAFKYVYRCKDKNNFKEDLDKAIIYLEQYKKQDRIIIEFQIPQFTVITSSNKVNEEDKEQYELLRYIQILNACYNNDKDVPKFRLNLEVTKLIEKIKNFRDNN